MWIHRSTLLEGDSNTASWMGGLMPWGESQGMVEEAWDPPCVLVPKLNHVASALLKVLSPPNSAVPHLECLHSHLQGSTVIIQSSLRHETFSRQRRAPEASLLFVEHHEILM